MCVDETHTVPMRTKTATCQCAWIGARYVNPLIVCVDDEIPVYHEKLVLYSVGRVSFILLQQVVNMNTTSSKF